MNLLRKSSLTLGAGGQALIVERLAFLYDSEQLALSLVL